MAKISDNEYVYISTRIKMRKKNLLCGDDLVRMASAASSSEALRLLAEKGYEPFDPDDAESLEASLSKRRGEVLSLLYKFAPDSRVIDVFKLKYDYHNLKVCIKDVTRTDLLSDAGTLKRDAVADAVLNEKWSELPEPFCAAAKAAKAAAVFDAQKADMALDAAMCKQMLDIAKQAGSKFLAGYVRLYIDTLNLKIIARAVRAGKSAEYIADCFISGAVPLNAEVSADFSKAAALYKDTALYAVAQGALSGSGSLASLDKACDDILLDYIRASRSVNFGEAHVISYLLSSEAEISAVRLVMSGRMSNVPAEKIIERLRAI